MSKKTEKAFEVLQKALQEDPSYAHSWHCNLAMSFKDSFLKGDRMSPESQHRVGNEGASRFMKLCFNVVTSNEMLDDKKRD